MTATVRDCLKLSTIVRHNLPFSTSAVTLPPPLRKSLPLGFIVRIIPIGRSYLYTLLVTYYLYYTSILSIYLGILAV